MKFLESQWRSSTRHRTNTAYIHSIHVNTTGLHDFEYDSRLFTCALFNDPVISSDNFTSRGKTINNINTESFRRNHNLCFVISNSVEPFYLSKSFSGITSLTYKKQTAMFVSFL